MARPLLFVTAALLVVVGSAFGCRSEDRSGQPTGDWERIAAGEDSGVQFEVWETGSDRDEYTCLNVELSPPPRAKLPSDDEPDLYKGRRPVCDIVPSNADPIQLLRISSGERYGLLLVALPDGATGTGELDDGAEIENAVAEDSSPNVDLFLSVFDPERSPAALELTGSGGDRTCRFEEDEHVPDVICEES